MGQAGGHEMLFPHNLSVELGFPKCVFHFKKMLCRQYSFEPETLGGPEPLGCGNDIRLIT